MSLLLSSAGICASNTGGGGGSPTATYLEFDDTPDGLVGWTPASVTKTGMDLPNTADPNRIAWDLSAFSKYAEGATLTFNAYTNAGLGFHGLRLATDAALSTDTRDLYYGNISNTTGNHTTLTGTITSGDIAAGRVYFGFFNSHTTGTLNLRNFTMGGNATEALDLTKPISKNVGFTVSGASSTGITLTGTTARNSVTWALPHYTGYADTETITFDIDSPGRVLVRVGRGSELNTTGGDTYDTIYDDTPGGSPEPITITLTSAMIAAHKRFFGIVNLDTSAVTITNFTTSTSPAPTSYDFDVSADTSTVGVSVNSVVGADTIFDVTDSNTGADGFNGEQITVPTADIETGVPFGIPPEFIDEDPAGTFNTRTGLWLASDGSETAPEIETDIWWTVDGELRGGEDGNSYVSPSTENGLEIKRHEAVKAAGIPAVGSPFIVTARAAYPEVGLQFSGSNQWFANWLSSWNSQNVLWFISLKNVIGASHNILGRDASNRLYGAASLTLNLGGASKVYTGTTTRRHILASLSGASAGNCTVKVATWTPGIAAGDPPEEETLSTTAALGFSGSNNYFNIHGSSTTTPGSGSSMVIYRNAIWNMGATTVPDIFDLSVQQKFFAGAKIVDPEATGGSRDTYGDAWIDLYGAASYINNGGGTARHYGTSGASPGEFNNRGTEDITEVA